MVSTSLRQRIYGASGTKFQDHGQYLTGPEVGRSMVSEQITLQGTDTLQKLSQAPCNSLMLECFLATSALETPSKA